MSLPQLSETLFLTGGGIETTLIFHEGIELPDFAAFLLLRDQAGRDAQHPGSEVNRKSGALMTADQAAAYHWPQIDAFAEASADLVTVDHEVGRIRICLGIQLRVQRIRGLRAAAIADACALFFRN